MKKPGALFPDVKGVSVVAIGASAGGVQALMRVLPGLRRETRACVLCVLHLSPDRPSLLAAVLSDHCRLPVKEAESAETVTPGTVYVAPPDYHLSFESDGTLSLSLEPPVLFSRPSIDLLFESVADSAGPKGLGILLTGANEDGARGLVRIRERGGLTVVQDPGEAHFPEMPLAALRDQRPSAVLSLEEISLMLGGL